MRNNIIKITTLFATILFLSLQGGCSGDSGNGNDAAKTPQVMPAQQIEGVVARVETEEITFNHLNTMLNSSAMVGLSIPALGTAERKQVMVTLLDKTISANLLYLDALQQGVDQQPAYQQDIRRFENAVLATLYRDKVLYSDIQVSEEEILEYYQRTADEGGELTDEGRMAIEATLRNDKLNTLKTRLRQRVREGVSVEIESGVLDPGGDAARTDDTVVAKVDGTPVTWGDVSGLMQGADKRADSAEFYIDTDTERLRRLDMYIDTLAMAGKARAAGLESDPVYLARTTEYRKTHLINMYRRQLAYKWTPSDDQLKAFFEANKDRIAVPEMRKLQMIVLETKEQAEDIKQRIESGELTMFQAARDYSIDPTAKTTLGEMGWVVRGSGFPELDEYTFFLEPDVVGGPVQSPAGWHLVKVLDVQDAQMMNLGEPQTQNKTMRLYMEDQFNSYVVGLRKNNFKVVVYDGELERQFQREAAFMAEMTEKAAREGSVTSEREADIQKWIAPKVQVPASQ